MWEGDFDQLGPLHSTSPPAAQATSTTTKPQSRPQTKALALSPRLLPDQRHHPGYGKVFPPQLQREDAFKNDYSVRAKANEQEQFPKNQGFFAVNLLRKGFPFKQAYEEACYEQDEEWAVDVAPKYPTSHPYFHFPHLQGEPTIKPDPHALTHWNLALLNAQVIEAEHMAAAAELSAENPNGLLPNYEWPVEPNPVDTRIEQRIQKWLAIVEPPETNVDDDGHPKATPCPDYNYLSDNACDTIPHHVSVAGVKIGLTDIKPGEAAIIEKEEGNGKQLTNGREHKSAKDTCQEIYRIYLWMRDMNDQQKSMGVQMQYRREVQILRPTHTWADARKDALKALGRSNTRRTPNWDDLGRRRREAARN